MTNDDKSPEPALVQVESNTLTVKPSAGHSDARSHFREYGVGVLKGAIGAIPYAGGLINEVLFEARARLKQERLETFIAELAADVEKLGEEKVDRAFLMSEEFSDLAEDVLTRVSRNRFEAKRAHFRNVLTKAIVGIRAPDFSTLFLNLLEEITDEELRIYANYYWTFEKLRDGRSEGTKMQVTALDYSGTDIMGLPPATFKKVLQSLIRKGLMFDDSFGRFETPAYHIVEPTELGAAFFEWISSVGKIDPREGA